MCERKIVLIKVDFLILTHWHYISDQGQIHTVLSCYQTIPGNISGAKIELMGFWFRKDNSDQNLKKNIKKG